MFEEELLDYPEITDDDIESDVVLRELQGITVKRKLVILKHWQEAEQTMIYGAEPPPGASDAFTGEPQPTFEDIETLIDWAREQGDDIFRLIDWFFDAPIERLGKTIETLEHLKLVTPENAKLARAQSRKTFVGLVRRQFARYEQLDWDYLIDLAQNELSYSVERPDVTMRRTLHNLETTGEIEYLGGGVYRWSGQKRP